MKQQTETNKIVENLDKPIMAFAGMIAGKTLNKLLDKFFATSSMNSNVAEFMKATIVTGSSLFAYQHATEQGSDNAQFFFIGMASSGVAKGVEIISGGQLDGLLDGALNGTTLGEEEYASDVYDMEEDEYVDDIYPDALEEGDDLNLPVLDTDVMLNTDNTDEDLQGEDQTIEDVDYEDVQVEEIYEID